MTPGKQVPTSVLKALGIQTRDFAVYYDLVQGLRARGVPFVSLAPGEEVPAHVGAVLTSPAEVEEVGHPFVVPFTSTEETIAEGVRLLEGPGPFRRCVIGIDPGERPGIAVLGDGRVLRLVHAASPEAVRVAVLEALRGVPAERYVLRIGHGAPTFRNRILQTLAGLDVQMELVDETDSTPAQCHGNAQRDTAAATAIALTPGAPLLASDVGPVRPTPGELREIQRKSRLASDGTLTITRSLARHVAMGHLTLDEAVDRMRQKA